MTDLPWLCASDLARAFADRRLSPVEVLQAQLGHIARFEPDLNVFTHLDAESAMAQARSAEQDILRGRHLGPLHGVAVGVKDIIDVAGLPTTCHSRILLDNVATHDAEAVARLRRAGPILIGKLATWEFAFGGPSFDLPFPPARNPWNREHQPGGSSSGSGAGLAAGFFPLALGSDTGGSIRNPAAFCGVVGLKPTYGLVSRRGAFPLSYTLDNVGPMARRVADVASLLQAIAGHDPGDPGSVARARQRYTDDLERGIDGLRVGVVRNFHEEDMRADPAVAAAFEDVVVTLRGEGAHVRSMRLPALRDFASVHRVILHAEAWSVHAPWLRTRPQDYATNTRRKLMMGAFFSAGDYVAAQRRRMQLIASVEDVLRDVDVLLVANSLDPADRLTDEPSGPPVQARQARTPFNVTGHPAIAIPSGFSRAGLPLSVQLVGRNFDEATLLRAAAAVERATRWHERRPPLDGGRQA